MRVIAKSRLREYWSRKEYRDAQQALRAWYAIVSKARWKTYHGLRADFPDASLAENDRVVFNIGGNVYRLIVKFEFRMDAVFIRFFGTHREYDRVDAARA
jgi:mRNA interferase HigB